jgi:hypothetical protein
MRAPPRKCFSGDEDLEMIVAASGAVMKSESGRPVHGKGSSSSGMMKDMSIAGDADATLFVAEVIFNLGSPNIIGAGPIRSRMAGTGGVEVNFPRRGGELYNVRTGCQY